MKKKLFKTLLLITGIVFTIPCNAMEAPGFALKSIQLKDGQLLQLSSIQNKKEQTEALQFVQKFFRYASIQYDHTIISAHLIAPQGPMLVGTAFFRPILQAPEEIVLTHLAVGDNFQKKGIGRELVDYVTQKTNCTTLLLTSAVTAIGFYNKMGFKEGKKKGEMRKDFSSTKKRPFSKTEK